MEDFSHQTEKQTIYQEGYYEGKKSCQKEIEQLKVLTRVNINKAHCLEEEIERLKKEEEWLIDIHAKQLHANAPFLLENETGVLKKDIVKRMQQALKEAQY